MKAFINKLPYSYQLGFRYAYSLIPVALRYDATFHTTYKFLQRSQWWSREQLEAYQMDELSRLLHHAYDHVPYYRRVFDERKLKPHDIKTIQNLTKLPFLTKQIIRENYNDLIAQNIPRRNLKLIKTSGSSGAPLSFYVEKNRTESLENAFIETLYNRVGFRSIYKRRVDLSWEELKRQNSFWEYNPAQNILKLSPRRLDEDSLSMYVDKIKHFHPFAIKAIPSTIIVLANFMRRNNISPFPTVKLVLLGSEMLYPWQRTLIEKAFNSRVFSCYGQNEKVVLAGECEKSNFLHIYPEYGVTELINEKGEQIQAAEEPGEIAGTGFNNYAMPFIRYKTNDIATFSVKTCTCGRKYHLFGRIEGRKQEYIVLQNGELVPLLMLPFSDLLRNIKQFQFYQDTPGEIILKIVKLPGYTQEDTDIINKKLIKDIDNLKLRIEFTDFIPTTERGKYSYMIQKLPIKFNGI